MDKKKLFGLLQLADLALLLASLYYKSDALLIAGAVGTAVSVALVSSRARK